MSEHLPGCFGQFGTDRSAGLLLFDGNDRSHLTIGVTDIPNAKGQQIDRTKHAVERQGEESQIVPVFLTDQPLRDFDRLGQCEMQLYALRAVLVPACSIAVAFFDYHEREGLQVRFFEKRTYTRQLVSYFRDLQSGKRGREEHETATNPFETKG